MVLRFVIGITLPASAGIETMVSNIIAPIFRA